MSAADDAASFELLPRVIGAAPGPEGSARIGSSGDGYLVVWSSGSPDANLNTEIRAARVSRDGELLDPAGFRISSGRGESPSVVWNGEFYLVTWSGWFGFDEGWGTWMRRVAPDGTLLEPAPVKIAAAYLATAPVWSGSVFLFLTGVGHEPFQGHIYDRDLRRIGEPFEANPVPGPSGSYVARFDGINFVVVFEGLFENRRRIYATVISQRGERRVAWKQIALDAHSPNLGGIGRRTYVSWQPYDDTTVVAAIDHDAKIVGGPVAIPSAGWNAFRLSDSRSGDTVALLMRSVNYAPSYKTLQLSADLRVIAERSIGDVPLDDVVLEPTGGGAAVFTASSGESGYPSVYFDRFQPGIVTLSEATLISRAPSWQQSPALAFDGTNFVAAWLDRAGGRYESSVTLTRIDASGRSLDDTGKALSGVGTYRSDGRVAVAARDGLSLVTWAGDQRYPDRRWIFGAKLDSDGTVFDDGLVVAPEACGTQIRSAASRTHFLTIWERCDNGEIHLVATPREGTTSSSQFIFGIADRHGYDVACAEDECLVAVAMMLPDAGWRVETMRVSSDGIPIEPAGRVGMERCYAPSLASDGTSFLLTCSDSSTQQIHAAVIREGVAAADGAIGAPGDPAYAPEAVWTGRNYAVVWQRLYHRPATLLLCRVAADGRPIGEVEEVATAAMPGRPLETQHTVASRGMGDVSVVWTRDPVTLDITAARLWMTLRAWLDPQRQRPVRRQ